MRWLGAHPCVDWDVKTTDAMAAKPVHLAVIQGHFNCLCYIVTKVPTPRTPPNPSAAENSNACGRVQGVLRVSALPCGPLASTVYERL